MKKCLEMESMFIVKEWWRLILETNYLLIEIWGEIDEKRRPERTPPNITDVSEQFPTCAYLEDLQDHPKFKSKIDK